MTIIESGQEDAQGCLLHQGSWLSLHEEAHRGTITSVDLLLFRSEAAN